MNDSSSSSSSSSWAPQSSEFCLEIPAAGLSNMVGAQTYITIAGRKSNSNPNPLPVYFECTDPSYNTGVGGIGFEIFAPEIDSTIGVPLASFLMTANSISFVVSKASGGVKGALRLNMFLWADPNVGEIQLSGSITPNVSLSCGWQHNTHTDTVNMGEWIAFGG